MKIMMFKFPWKWVSISAVVFCGIVVLGCLLPAPIEGFWISGMTQCLCDSKNYVEFRDGTANVSSSGHPDMRGQNGFYRKVDEKWIWETKRSDLNASIELYPTWLMIRMIDRKNNIDTRGFRVFWPPTLRAAKANFTPIGAEKQGDEQDFIEPQVRP